MAGVRRRRKARHPVQGSTALGAHARALALLPTGLSIAQLLLPTRARSLTLLPTGATTRQDRQTRVKLGTVQLAGEEPAR